VPFRRNALVWADPRVLNCRESRGPLIGRRRSVLGQSIPASLYSTSEPATATLRL
jgi:hypothetical protein